MMRRIAKKKKKNIHSYGQVFHIVFHKILMTASSFILFAMKTVAYEKLSDENLQECFHANQVERIEHSKYVMILPLKKTKNVLVGGAFREINMIGIISIY